MKTNFIIHDKEKTAKLLSEGKIVSILDGAREKCLTSSKKEHRDL